VIFGLIRSDIGWEYNIVLIAAFAIALMAALIPHEVAHGYAALKQGDPSAKIAGRLSLNPAKHIEPLGLLCFVLAGIGWAKPVPVNPFNYRNFRKGNFWVSIAGVLTNLVIGFTFSLFLFLMYNFVGMDSINNNVGLYFVYYLFLFIVIVNIMLMLFNLLPIFPLDGYNVLVSFTKPNNSFMRFMRQYSMFVLMGVLMVLIFTGWLVVAREWITDLFLSFWDIIF